MLFQIYPHGYISLQEKADLASYQYLPIQYNIIAAFFAKQDPSCGSEISYQVSA